MEKSACCENVGLKKGPWTPEEDQKLVAFIQQNHGHGSWRSLPSKAGLRRCGKSCRLRWTNYLRPDIKRGKFSLQEDQTIIQLHALLGNRWSAIAAQLPNRTDNEIKNYWNTQIKKRLTKMGIDPITHRPKTYSPIAASSSFSSSSYSNLSHMAQWESARLQAEARLVRESKLMTMQLHSNNNNHHQYSTPPPPPCLDVLKAWQNQNQHSWSTNRINSKNLLESPTSTLCFTSNSNCQMTSSSSSWGYLTKKNPEKEKSAAAGADHVINIIDDDEMKVTAANNNNNNHVVRDDDDDIMVAVEAFTTCAPSAVGEAAYDNKIVDIADVPPLSSTAGLNITDDDAGMMVYDDNNDQHSLMMRSLAIMEEEEDENNSNHYWDTILHLLNDPQHLMF